MKKYIIGILIAVGMLTSLQTVHAYTALSQRKIDVVVEVLRAFDVEESKIRDIVKILKKESKPKQKTNTQQQKLLEPKAGCISNPVNRIMCAQA